MERETVSDLSVSLNAARERGFTRAAATRPKRTWRPSTAPWSRLRHWLFVDASKNGTRRWCDMTAFGNRAKARRHYLKSRQR
jgi:hypothetical protein